MHAPDLRESLRTVGPSGIDTRRFFAPSRTRFGTWAGLDGTEPIETVLARLRKDPGRVPRVLVSIVSTLTET